MQSKAETERSILFWVTRTSFLRKIRNLWDLTVDLKQSHLCKSQHCQFLSNRIPLKTKTKTFLTTLEKNTKPHQSAAHCFHRLLIEAQMSLKLRRLQTSLAKFKTVNCTSNWPSLSCLNSTLAPVSSYQFFQILLQKLARIVKKIDAKSNRRSSLS